MAEVSKENTGGGEGVEVQSNEPFANKQDLFKDITSGQYTYKLYKMQRFIEIVNQKNKNIYNHNCIHSAVGCHGFLEKYYPNLH